MPTANRPPDEKGTTHSVLLPLLVLAATFIAYVGTLQFEFVYDDLGQIVNNPVVHSWRYLPWYFHSNVWMQQYAVGNYYRPLFLFWLLLNYTLFGLHPLFWHLTTVLAHLAATGMVYLLARRLTSGQVTAAIAALFFGVHPIHLEAVAWISGVTEPLLATLLLPAFLCYLNHRERGRERPWLLLSLLLFALALLTKETAVVLPALLFAYEWIYVREAGQPYTRRLASSLRSIAPYLVLLVPYLLARANALQGLAHQLVNISPRIAFLSIPSVLWFYVKKLVFPVPLSAFYDMPYITHFSWQHFWGPLLGVLGAALIVGMWWWRSRSRLVAFAAAWLVLPLLPLLDLRVLPQGDFVHDRYLYLPSIGFSILLALALRKLEWGRRKLLGRPAVEVAGALVLALLLAVGTVVQSVPWANELLLFYHGMAIAPINDLPSNLLGNALVRRGMYAEGIKIYRIVLARDPTFWFANYRMGYAQYMLGHYSEAELYLGRAVAVHPLPEELYYLGLTRLNLGRLEEASADLQQALRAAPGSPGYNYALGLVLKKQGKLEAARQHFQAELAKNPHDAAARRELEELGSGSAH
jgi:tetratricopeptide (TPR) repeat protein